MTQIKEQDKILGKQHNKMKASNLPDSEFKTLVIRMLNELRGSTNVLNENYKKEIGDINKKIENIKENQSEMKLQ